MTSKKRWLPSWASRKARPGEPRVDTAFDAYIDAGVSETAATTNEPAESGDEPDPMAAENAPTTPEPGAAAADLGATVEAEATTAQSAVPTPEPARSDFVSMTSKKRWLPSWASRKARSGEPPVDNAVDAYIGADAPETAATTNEPAESRDEPAATTAEPSAATAEAEATTAESAVATPEPAEAETARRRFLPGRKQSAGRPAVGGGLMRPFNLLPQQEVVEKTPSVGIGRLAAVGAIVVGIVGLGVWYAAESQSLGNAETDRDDLVELLEKPAPAAGGSSVGQAQRALFADQLLRTDAIAGVLNERVAWDRVLTSVARVFPEGVWFTGMTATTPTALQEAVVGDDSAPVDPVSLLPRLSISGFAEDHEQLAVLMGRLTALRELEDIKLESSGSTLIGTTDAVQFSVSAAVTPGRTS